MKGQSKFILMYTIFHFPYQVTTCHRGCIHHQECKCQVEQPCTDKVKLVHFYTCIYSVCVHACSMYWSIILYKHGFENMCINVCVYVHYSGYNMMPQWMPHHSHIPMPAPHGMESQPMQPQQMPGGVFIHVCYIELNWSV